MYYHKSKKKTSTIYILVHKYTPSISFNKYILATSTTKKKKSADFERIDKLPT